MLSRLASWPGPISNAISSLWLVQWPLLKHVDRSVYNVSFFYHRDVSRLTDVVRQRLIFRSLADLESCLATILKDRELEVAGVKTHIAFTRTHSRPRVIETWYYN